MAVGQPAVGVSVVSSSVASPPAFRQNVDMRAAAIAALTLALGGCGGTYRHEPVAPERPSLTEVMPHWSESVVDHLTLSWPDDHRRPFLAAVAPAALRSSAEQALVELRRANLTHLFVASDAPASGEWC